MKLIVKKAAIESAANLLSRVINPKNALPILGDILCEVKDKKMQMTASDSEMTLTTCIELEEMEGDGQFCVSAAWLKDALSQLIDQPLTILATTDGDMRCTIQHNSGETFFPCESADEYPLPKQGDYTETLAVKYGELLRDTLKRTLWAISNDELRSVMNGVNFALNEGYLDIVASDGHVLVKSHCRIIDNVQIDRVGSFVMPKKVAKILSESVESGDIVTIEWNELEGHIAMQACDITFRLIEGKFPNYNSIIPTDQPLCATVPRAFMMNSIKKVIPFTTDNSGAKMLRMAFDNGKLTLTGEDIDFAVGAHDTFLIDYDADPITIGVSGSQMLAIMSKIDGQECNISMTDPSHAIVIEPSEQDLDCDVLMLVMPMMLVNS